jgi:hypothetical protein
VRDRKGAGQLSEHFAGATRTAQIYMQLSRRGSELEANTQDVAHLTISAALEQLGGYDDDEEDDDEGDEEENCDDEGSDVTEVESDGRISLDIEVVERTASSNNIVPIHAKPASQTWPHVSTDGVMRHVNAVNFNSGLENVLNASQNLEPREMVDAAKEANHGRKPFSSEEIDDLIPWLVSFAKALRDADE